MAHCLKEKTEGLFARFSYVRSVAWQRLLEMEEIEGSIHLRRRIRRQADESQTGRGSEWGVGKERGTKLPPAPPTQASAIEKRRKCESNIGAT